MSMCDLSGTIHLMDDRSLTNQEAEAINDQMAAAMERRRAMPNQRTESTAQPREDRRRVCGYCFQRGDHPTAAHCMRALERADADD
jgi:hypothetical protein